MALNDALLRRRDSDEHEEEIDKSLSTYGKQVGNFIGIAVSCAHAGMAFCYLLSIAASVGESRPEACTNATLTITDDAPTDDFECNRYKMAALFAMLGGSTALVTSACFSIHVNRRMFGYSEPTTAPRGVGIALGLGTVFVGILMLGMEGLNQPVAGTVLCATAPVSAILPWILAGIKCGSHEGNTAVLIAEDQPSYQEHRLDIDKPETCSASPPPQIDA